MRNLINKITSHINPTRATSFMVGVGIRTYMSESTLHAQPIEKTENRQATFDKIIEYTINNGKLPSYAEKIIAEPRNQETNLNR